MDVRPISERVASVPASPTPNPGDAPGSKVEFVDAISSLEQMVFQDEGLYSLHGDALRAFRQAAITEAFEWHYARCESYRRYCEGAGFGPQELRASCDLSRIPLLPTSVFKKKEILSVPKSAIAKVCLSSGTQGTHSRVCRDQTSLERLLGSVKQGLAVLGDHGDDRERRVFVLGPDTSEAEDLWFSYVLSLVDFLYPTTFYVQGGVFQPERALEDLCALAEGPQPLIVGPPFLILELAKLARSQGRRPALGKQEALVLTAGGWKRFQGSAVSREEFDAAIEEGLGVDAEHIRDTFNMVELNTVLFECAEGAKHVPPWLFASARDAASMRPRPAGEEGLLSFCDPLATSYPCFLMTDDLGRVSEEDQCACGRWGQRLEISRRVARVEARGCALKMDRTIAVQQAGGGNG